MAAVVTRLASVLFVVALPLLAVTTNVRVAASELRVYEWAIDRYGAVERTGLPREELVRASEEIIAYFGNDARELRIIVTVDGEETSLFNAREVEHMADVKSVMRAVFRLQEVALAYVLAYPVLRYLWAREAPLRSLAREVFAGAALGIALLGGAAVAVAVGFDAAWTTLHELLFRNDLWRLDPANDRLIQMFPEPFWQDISLIIGIASLAELTVAALAAGVGLIAAWRSRSGTEVRLPAQTPAVGTVQGE